MSWLALFAWISLAIGVLLVALYYFAGMEELRPWPLAFFLIATGLNLYRFRNARKSSG